MLRSMYRAHTECTFSKVFWTRSRLGVLLSGRLRSMYIRSLVLGRDMFSFCCRHIIPINTTCMDKFLTQSITAKFIRMLNVSVWKCIRFGRKERSWWLKDSTQNVSRH